MSAPSWSSMVPGSPFLREQRQTHLPEETRYYLFLSYRGSRSGLVGENNDDESHTSILRSEAVAAALGEVLAEVDAGIIP